MEPQPMQIEGTWEQILQLAPKLNGRRVRLIVLPNEIPKTDTRPIEEVLEEIWADVPEEELAKLSKKASTS